MSTCAYQEAEIFPAGVSAADQSRAADTPEQQLCCQCAILVKNQMVVDTANERSGRQLSFAVSRLSSRAKHVAVLVVPKTEADENRSRESTHYSLLTTHYSPLTTHYSPLTTRYSLLATHYSLLTTHCSLLTTDD